MANILIVCTANICRSPVAAAILSDRLRQRGLDDWKVLSAGTWAMVSRGASRFSIVVARRAGLDLTHHRAMMVNEGLLRGADLVLTMEDGHAEALRVEFPDDAHKVHLLSEMGGPRFNVPDPYGGPLEGYERMYDELVELIDGGMDRIVELSSRNEKSRVR